MARQREFDREHVLRRAQHVFWRQGFAGTSTDDLLAEMGVGRQSMYNTFGGKRDLYLEVLRSYQESAVANHLARLNAPASPLEGIRDLLVGLAVDDDAVRALGCFGVGSVGEFGAADEEVAAATRAANARLSGELTDRVGQAKALGEISETLDAATVAAFLVLSMNGLQIAARSGASAESMRVTAEFAVDRLRS